MILSAPIILVVLLIYYMKQILLFAPDLSTSGYSHAMKGRKWLAHGLLIVILVWYFCDMC